jgi:hypothetical protein
MYIVLDLYYIGVYNRIKLMLCSLNTRLKTEKWAVLLRSTVNDR